ncbi:MAG: histidinol dehydrogenase, partial [Vicinamibacteria bacterium]
MRTLRFGTAAWRLYVASLPRSGRRDPRLERAVAAVLADVRRRGDEALVRLTERFDGVRLSRPSLRVAPGEIRALARSAPAPVVAALGQMARRIEAYHRRQRDEGFLLSLPGGGSLAERVGPLASVGLYVPGGAGAYPSSVLMNAIPARIAGVPRVVVVTPPRTLESNPALAAALLIAGVESSVFRIGGAQAIAALAHGTEQVPKVAKIVGPGNAYVAAAKRQLRGFVEIDHDAGPSEVVVLADDSADATWVAVDLLAQAEH